MQILGAILCALAGLRLLQSIVRARQDTAAAGVREQQALELLNEQIAATRALRVRQEQQQLHWNGYRKFRVKQKVRETDNICSFYLTPHDGKPLPVFRPGQFLTFRFMLPGNKPGETKPVVRCYSLSDAPRPEQFRISVKRVPPDGEGPAGLISNFLHDEINTGDLLDVQAPRGEFAVDPADSRPIVLIAGGIGVTPMLSMVNTILTGNSSRDVWLFYGVRNRSEHVMQDHLQRLSAAHGSFRLSVSYSNPAAGDVPGAGFDRVGHVDVEHIRQALKISNFDYYVCGPPAMMASIVTDLKSWGVSDERVHTEAFGPAAVRRAPLPATADPDRADQVDGGYHVEFARSGRRIAWDPRCCSLLEFAEQHDVSIDSGCRAGSCGSCEVAIRAGQVAAVGAASTDVGAGMCLACVTIPEGDLSLDI